MDNTSSNSLNVALTLSGGGYRAATFHLGVLSYMDSIKIGGKSLMDFIIAISTVSGGSITGLFYMMKKAQNENVENSEIWKELYHFLTSEDLVTDGLSRLSSNPESLIKAMATVYNDKLFHGAEAGLLMDYVERNDNLHQIAANATDFNNGLPFRFQFTDKVDSTKNFEYGLVGNGKYSIPRNMARHIKLGDILACSSCFPGGFEPMMFPDTFNLVGVEGVDKLPKVGIMDGGIDDNQGIDSILLAEQQLEKKLDISDNKAVIDLIIISDVSTGKFTPYSPSTVSMPKLIGKIKLKMLFPFKSMRKWIDNLLKGTVMEGKTDYLMNLRISEVVTLLANRLNCLMLLTQSIFMKRVRGLSYERVYRDDKWNGRVISNIINSTVTQQNCDLFNPSDKLKENSVKAMDFGTTLWFTSEDFKNNIPEALIAAGQYSVCMNLLKYVRKIEADANFSNGSNAKILLQCKEQLEKDWKAFNENPYCMTGLVK